MAIIRFALFFLACWLTSLEAIGNVSKGCSGGWCEDESEQMAVLQNQKKTQRRAAKSNRTIITPEDEKVINELIKKAGSPSQRDVVETLQQRLQHTTGYATAFFKACVKEVDQIGSSDLDTILHSFVPACRRGSFHKIAVDHIDPKLLSAECNRFGKQMRLQHALLGTEVFSTAQSICTVAVEAVLPIVQEGGCQRYLENIQDLLIGRIKNEPRKTWSGSLKWPGVIQKHEFSAAFTEICTDTEGLDCEVVDTGEPCTDHGRKESCAKILENLRALDFSGKHTIAEVFAEICPVLQLPVEETSFTQRPPLTARARSGRAFEVAALLQRQRQHSQAAVQFKTVGFKQGMADMLDQSLEMKRTGLKGRALGGITMESAVVLDAKHFCCEKVAYTNEAGIEGQVGVAFGAETVVRAFGFKQINEDGSCETADVPGGTTKCISFSAPGISLGVYLVKGFFHNISQIPGEAISYGTDISAGIFGFGGGFMYSLDQVKKISNKGTIDFIKDLGPTASIGEYIESGFGIDVDVLKPAGVGVGVDVTVCDTTDFDPQLFKRNTRTHHGILEQCPAKNANCFPSDAEVQTPTGKKKMIDLRVGDRVLADDGEGNLFFDDIYFFGHADPQALEHYVRLQIEGLSQDLFISEDHFLPTCQLPSQSCTYDQRIFAYARSVQAGHHVWIKSADCDVDGCPLELLRITRRSMVLKSGLYNPYTLSGSIIVNGFLASSHSSWVLDPWVPDGCKELLPFIYQALFLPGRILYFLAGAAAADFLDVNNPQAKPETFGYGPHFLLSVLMGLSAGLMQARIHFRKANPKAGFSH